MKKITVKDVPIADTPHKVEVRPLFSFEHATFVKIVLQPGETLKKHITPVDAIFYGLKGTGVVEIGEECEEISSEELVFSPKGIPHKLLNENSEPFEFLVIKVPTQTSKSQIL